MQMRTLGKDKKQSANIRRTSLARSVSLAAMVTGLLVSSMTDTVHAQQAEPQSNTHQVAQFSIPAQDLNQALLTFTDQAGLQVFYDVDRVQGQTSTTLSGSYTPSEALKVLLSGTGLSYRFSDDNTVSIQKIDTSSQSGQQVDPIYVEANSVSLREENGLAVGYVATSASTATKGNTPLIETPRSVSVVSSQELQDRAASNLVDALAYTAGVSINDYGFDPRFDQVFVRGKPLYTSGDYRDGLRQPYISFGMFRTDPYSLEQVEVIKGPSAALYGQSTPGGVMNSISKRPGTGAENEVYGRYTDTGTYETGFDYNMVVTEDGEWQGRFVGLARTGETSNEIADDRYMFMPSVRWQPNDLTDITVYSIIQKDESDASASLLNLDGDILDYRASDPEYDELFTTQFQTGYEFSHQFEDTDLRFVQKARAGYFDLDGRYLTGSVSGGGWNGADTEYSRGRTAIGEELWNAQIDNQLHYEFETGDVKHSTVYGIDYLVAQSDFGLGSAAASSEYTFLLSDPNRRFAGPSPALTSYTKAGYWQVGSYALDQISYENWRLSLGARYDYAEQTKKTDNLRTGAHTNKDGEEHAATYNAGLLYAFENGVSPYISYATSFLPGTNADVSGNFIEPTEGEQFEIGIKYQPKGVNSYITLSAYNLVEDNIARYNSVGSYYEPVGTVETNGIEIEGRLAMTESLNMVAGYSYNDSEITKGSNAGSEPAQTPKNTATIWVDYSFLDGALDGLGLGAGARYKDSTYSSSNPSSRKVNKSYTMFDAALTYDLGALGSNLDGLSVALNATNLTDEKAKTCDAYICYQTEGRTIAATLRYNW